MARTIQQEVPGRSPLTAAAVLGRAVELADAEGLDAVTIRRLGKELGVTPMALYWHFRGKDALLDALVDRAVADVDLAVDLAVPWQQQFGSLMRSIVGMLRAHPWITALLSRGGLPSEGHLGVLEVMLDVLRRAGFTPEQATTVARHALSTAAALVGGEPGYAPRLSPEELADRQHRFRGLLEKLPGDRYPRIIEAAVPLSTCDDPDGYYAFGLDLLLAGIEAMAPRAR
ncbi:MAG: TetR family transcriptional regulator [Streptosporangiales bacterium]|nr:TetR family transcriptional regulator [Streptosporangiales bacterium]